MKDIPVFPVTSTEDAIAAEYQRLLGIPDRARADCVHLAVCVTNRVDYLLTWNCTHLGTVAQAAQRARGEDGFPNAGMDAGAGGQRRMTARGTARISHRAYESLVACLRESRSRTTKT